MAVRGCAIVPGRDRYRARPIPDVVLTGIRWNTWCAELNAIDVADFDTWGAYLEHQGRLERRTVAYGLTALASMSVLVVLLTSVVG